MKAMLIYDNFGPYHKYRFNVFESVFETLGVQLFGKSFEYDWLSAEDCGSDFITLSTSHEAARVVGERLRAKIREYHPDVIFIPGWSSKYALTALDEATRAGAATVLCTDSQRQDKTRSFFKELVKSSIVNNFDFVFSAGKRSTNYVKQLGFPSDRVVEGMNVVDNQHFRNSVLENTNTPFQRQTFVCPARLVAKKNIDGLLNEYKEYTSLVPRKSIIALSVVGDGPMLPKLKEITQRLELEEYVTFRGFLDYSRMPLAYSEAVASVLASTEEPWGLVINESLASGTPVLVSINCGATTDLIQHGDNGFSFDPGSPGELARHFAKMSEMSDQQLQVMRSNASASIESLSRDVYKSRLEKLKYLISCKGKKRKTTAGKVGAKITAFTRERE